MKISQKYKKYFKFKIFILGFFTMDRLAAPPTRPPTPPPTPPREKAWLSEPVFWKKLFF